MLTFFKRKILQNKASKNIYVKIVFLFARHFSCYATSIYLPFLFLLFLPVFIVFFHF